jgi:ribosome biogenesis GTPase
MQAHPQIEQDGLVVKSTGSWYQVRSADGVVHMARIKGKFRTLGLKTTNPIAVGDQIRFKVEDDQETVIINHLYPRKNYIIRKSINLSKQAQIIAANLDQAFLVVTLASPPTSLGFIDRFLVSAEAYRIPVTILFNKLDLFSEEGLVYLKDFQDLYEKAGYPTMAISALDGTSIEAVRDRLKDKTTLISGHSGVGKSTLINALLPGVDLRTGAISDWSDKGKHTTTFAEMFPLEEGGYLIDTPGIQELGLIEIESQELSHYFPEMRQLLNQCKYHNCRHIQEPGCVIREAVREGEIAESRYESYLSMFHGNETRY